MFTKEHLNSIMILISSINLKVTDPNFAENSNALLSLKVAVLEALADLDKQESVEA